MDQIFENLKTGKPHVSFSELSCWKECSWRHKLQYVDKLGEVKQAAAFVYGTAQHCAIQDLISTGDAQLEKHSKTMVDAWQKHDFEKEMPLEHALSSIRNITNEFKQFLDNTLPGWKCVACEYPLYEAIPNSKQAFKGYIDIVLQVPGKRNKMLHWIIDLKTTQWGWDRDKKSNEVTKYQLILYKHYWARKLNIDPKDIRCAFILLKKRGKQGSLCEIVPVSVGDITTERANKALRNMLASIERGIAIKNRASCQWCEFKNTEHCK